ncbi:unnamed protein product, partial [Phaeothamnion confervicola]
VRDANSVRQEPATPARGEVIERAAVDCVCCMGRPRSVVLLPCRHFECCQICGSSLVKCPTCNAIIADKMNMFIS